MASRFQSGIQRAVAIFNAGVRGQPMPDITGARLEDARAVWTEGRMEALAEIDKLVESQRWEMLTLRQMKLAAILAFRTPRP